ncbi:MAG: hypothetical protein QM504_07975 [Pseudomonadota bacterium]
MLLDKLFPFYDEGIVSTTYEEVVFISIEIDDIKKLDDKIIVDLVRCEIDYDDEYETLFFE